MAITGVTEDYMLRLRKVRILQSQRDSHVRKMPSKHIRRKMACNNEGRVTKSRSQLVTEYYHNINIMDVSCSALVLLPDGNLLRHLS